MTDLTFSAALIDFDSTEVEVAHATDAGRQLFDGLFGAGAVSVSLPKTKAADLAEFVDRKGLTWSIEENAA